MMCSTTSAGAEYNMSKVSFNCFNVLCFLNLSDNCPDIFFTVVCLLPIPPPTQICSCGPNQDFSILPGKQTVLVTINGMVPFPFVIYIPSEGDVK